MTWCLQQANDKEEERRIDRLKETYLNKKKNKGSDKEVNHKLDKGTHING